MIIFNVLFMFVDLIKKYSLKGFQILTNYYQSLLDFTKVQVNFFDFLQNNLEKEIKK